MSNGEDTIIHLIVGLIKKALYETNQYFLSRLEDLEEISMFKLIYQIMQQRLI